MEQSSKSKLVFFSSTIFLFAYFLKTIHHRMLRAMSCHHAIIVTKTRNKNKYKTRTRFFFSLKNEKIKNNLN